MHKTIKNLQEIETMIKHISHNVNNLNKTKVIAVSKTFKINDLIPLLDHGHINFGENKVQEAVEKWSDIRGKYTNLLLHMIGGLQTNKVKQAVSLFDYIHSVDSTKLAKKISEEQKKQNRNLKLFIQLNIGNEIQKKGIQYSDLKDFKDYCVNDLNLKIIGLMCIPPINSNPKEIFSKMKTYNDELGLTELSMGMSSDYLEASNNGATFVRIGSKIFGNRS